MYAQVLTGLICSVLYYMLAGVVGPPLLLQRISTVVALTFVATLCTLSVRYTAKLGRLDAALAGCSLVYGGTVVVWIVIYFFDGLYTRVGTATYSALGSIFAAFIAIWLEPWIRSWFR